MNDFDPDKQKKDYEYAKKLDEIMTGIREVMKCPRGYEVQSVDKLIKDIQKRYKKLNKLMEYIEKIEDEQ